MFCSSFNSYACIIQVVWCFNGMYIHCTNALVHHSKSNYIINTHRAMLYKIHLLYEPSNDSLPCLSLCYRMELINMYPIKIHFNARQTIYRQFESIVEDTTEKSGLKLWHFLKQFKKMKEK